MKVSLVTLAAASFLVLTSAFGEPVTLMTWNLEWFPGRNPAPDFAREAIQISQVHEELEKMAPDIVLLQEVRDAENAQLAVKILPGMQVRVASDFPPQFGNGQQLAIASKLEPEETGEIAFPQYRGDPPRGFVYARFEIGGEQVLIYNVHLKSNNGGIAENIPKREIAIRHLIAHYQAWLRELEERGIKDVTAILGGDYNSDPGDPRFAAEETTRLLTNVGFRWALRGLPADRRVTWPGNGTYPDACLDHIFYVPGKRIQITAARVHAGTARAADHCAVSVQLRY